MKSVVTADFHAQLPHDNWQLMGGMSRPTELQKVVFEMGQKGLDAGAREFIVLGDIFHVCNPSSKARTDVNFLLFKLKEMGYEKIILLLGNHDYSKTSAHALKPLWYEAPWVQVVDYVGPDEKRPFCWAPHLSLEEEGTYQRYWDIVAAVSADRYVLGHLTAEGARAGSEGTMLAGKPILWKDMPTAKGVLLGHIHKPQIVKPGVDYVGSPRCCDFGERGEIKRFIIADFDAGEFQSVHVESGYKYVQYDLHADELSSEEWGGAQGAIVKVNVTSDRFLGTQDIRKALMDAGVAYINSINVALEREKKEVGGFSETMTPKQALEGFFKKDTDREALVDQGCAILEEVGS